MIVVLRFFKYSAKISSIPSISNDIKNKFIQYAEKLSQVFHKNRRSLVAYGYLLPTLRIFHVDSCSPNGKNKLVPQIHFIDRKIDPLRIHQMVFSQKNNFWHKLIRKKHKKFCKSSNKIISTSLVNAAIVKQNFSSNMDSLNMIKSYRDVVNASKLASEGRNLKEIIAEIRYDVLTPYGKWIKDGWLDDRAKQGTFIKIVSYNILAQSLLEGHPYLYRDHDERFLRWNYRSYILTRELNRFDADILCLQEVEADKLGFFNTQLGVFGYKGIFKKRTHDKEDGCAIYFKQDKFDVRESVSVEYYQPNISILDRDNIGLVLRLSPKGSSNQCIVIANTHLLFNPRRHDIKLAQMQILLAEIDRVAFKSANGNHQSSYYPVILTGDFNLQPYTVVYNLLVDGVVNRMPSPYRNFDYPQRSPNKQLIPVRLGITDSCQHYHVTKNRRTNRTEISDFQHVQLFNTDRKSLKRKCEDVNDSYKISFDSKEFGSGCLQHNLNFASVYPHADSSVRDATTYQDGWCTVDYIFYGPMLSRGYVNEKKTEGELKLVSYLKLPNVNQATCLGHIPNEICPSDHLPLCATFHLPVGIYEQPKKSE